MKKDIKKKKNNMTMMTTTPTTPALWKVNWPVDLSIPNNELRMLHLYRDRKQSAQCITHAK